MGESGRAGGGALARAIAAAGLPPISAPPVTPALPHAVPLTPPAGDRSGQAAGPRPPPLLPPAEPQRSGEQPAEARAAPKARPVSAGRRVELRVSGTALASPRRRPASAGPTVGQHSWADATPAPPSPRTAAVLAHGLGNLPRAEAKKEVVCAMVETIRERVRKALDQVPTFEEQVAEALAKRRLAAQEQERGQRARLEEAIAKGSQRPRPFSAERPDDGRPRSAPAYRQGGGRVWQEQEQRQRALLEAAIARGVQRPRPWSAEPQRSARPRSAPYGREQALVLDDGETLRERLKGLYDTVAQRPLMMQVTPRQPGRPTPKGKSPLLRRIEADMASFVARRQEEFAQMERVRRYMLQEKMAEASERVREARQQLDQPRPFDRSKPTRLRQAVQANRAQALEDVPYRGQYSLRRGALCPPAPPEARPLQKAIAEQIDGAVKERVAEKRRAAREAESKKREELREAVERGAARAALASTRVRQLLAAAGLVGPSGSGAPGERGAS